MKHAFLTFTLVLVYLLQSLVLQAQSIEAMEVGPKDTDPLPRGKEADGIIGDFVLRNTQVEALISHNAPLRRANMSTFYGEDGITPGCLYDLDRRGGGNDQITIFAPLDQRGRVSYVRIMDVESPNETAVETVVNAANNKGAYVRHEYRLKAEEQGIWITSTVTNESKETVTQKLADRWTTFTQTGEWKGIHWANAVDPSNKRGYAYQAWMAENEQRLEVPKEKELQPGESIQIVRFLAVGGSPAEAVGLVERMSHPTGTLHAFLQDAEGHAVPDAWLEIQHEEKSITAYPNDDAKCILTLKPGKYELKASAPGRDTLDMELEIHEEESDSIHFDFRKPSGIRFDIADANGNSIPCKAQFIGLGDTKTPNLGPQNRAHGCRDQYHSETGQFHVALAPGRYRVIVTRGVEFSHLEREILVESESFTPLKGYLHRLVDTTGWVSADFHNHSTPSGDNTCGTEDRVINLAAEHIEFAPTTEHNRLYDWEPYIKKLGLSGEIFTIKGMELTGSGTHFNAFPFQPKPHTQDWGAPVWQKDPRLNAIVLRDFQGQDSTRWIQANHPDMVDNFLDRNGDGILDGGYLGLSSLMDGLETQNGNSAYLLSGAPYHIVKNDKDEESIRYHREFIWLQMLNQGLRNWAVAVADAHSVYGNGVGGWRCFVKSSTDIPAKIDWKEISRNAKAGRMILSAGPFMTVETLDGDLPGSEIRAAGGVTLKVVVQCTDWIDIDRVQILVNGQQAPEFNFKRSTHPEMFSNGVVKFDREIHVPLQSDSHLIVVAYGENFDLSKGFGTSPQSSLNPCAYNNPIFVDVDGGGFRPNGDTLGFPLPVKKMEVAEAKAWIEKSRP